MDRRCQLETDLGLDDELHAVDVVATVVVVPRAGFESPPHLTLAIEPSHLEVSSTLARSGRVDLMAPEAADSGLWSSG